MQQLTEKQQRRIQLKQSEKFMKKMGASFAKQQNKIIVDALKDKGI